ncbi:uncharacterized protein [Prorops nasuta]|uniref:uncharacterized protein n=1 Tax=Prorops nasuta TaxID=863751 RepID=UPI0034CD8890
MASDRGWRLAPRPVQTCCRLEARWRPMAVEVRSGAKTCLHIGCCIPTSVFVFFYVLRSSTIIVNKTKIARNKSEPLVHHKASRRSYNMLLIKMMLNPYNLLSFYDQPIVFGGNVGTLYYLILKNNFSANVQFFIITVNKIN